MNTIEAYRPHYRPPQEGGLAPGMCIDDRLRAIGVQTPGEAAGAVSDVDMSLRANGIVVPEAILTELVLQALRIERKHNGVCTGRAAIPHVPELVAAAGEAALQTGASSLGLGLGENTVGRMTETATAMHANGIKIQPDTRAARRRLNAQQKPVTASPLSVGDRKHEAEVILANLTTEQFDPAAAWKDGKPAYNIDFVSSERQLFNLLSALSVPPEDYLAALALRSLVTADALPTPASGQPLRILVHQPSFAREYS